MAKGLDRLTGKSVKQNGYIGRTINDNYLDLRDRDEQHMRHKPYSCDFTSKIISNREQTKKLNEESEEQNNEK